MHTLDLEIRNASAEIPRVSERFAEFAREVRLPSDATVRVELAFDELLTNIISYGFADGSHHEIAVHAEYAEGCLTVTISDDGTPFDPMNAPPADTTSSLEDREVGGLGVHLVRSTMEEVSYERRGDRNVVTLKLRIEAGD